MEKEKNDSSIPLAYLKEAQEEHREYIDSENNNIPAESTIDNAISALLELNDLNAWLLKRVQVEESFRKMYTEGEIDAKALANLLKKDPLIILLKTLMFIELYNPENFSENFAKLRSSTVTIINEIYPHKLQCEALIWSDKKLFETVDKTLKALYGEADLKEKQCVFMKFIDFFSDANNLNENSFAENNVIAALREDKLTCDYANQITNIFLPLNTKSAKKRGNEPGAIRDNSNNDYRPDDDDNDNNSISSSRWGSGKW